jgi:2,4-dienoyl-CoA reductase-like NADH-dependent reductase (Old Yellow Enzyme family)
MTNSAFPLLMSSFQIRGVEVRNRLVFQPHFTALGTIEGMLSDDQIAYYEERAYGGVGLVVFESQAVHPTGKMSRRFINAWDSAVVPWYVRLTEAVHGHGARIFGQLTHAGHTSLERPPPILWAPTQMPEPSSNQTTMALTDEDIAVVIDGFAAAARNAVAGGFDGIEVKIAHDGLLRSFASPFFNRRTDRYGGSFEKRMRLPVEVLQAIKEATSADYPVGVRLCLHEYTPFGYELDYGLRIAEHLEASGAVDYFNCDAGSFSSFWMNVPPFAVEQGFFRPLNRALKANTDLPVVAHGRLKRPDLAEHILRCGEADLIGMCRQLIADPETPRKVLEGRADEIRYCVGCSDACIYQVMQEKGIRCIHNPGAGRERELGERHLRPAAKGANVVIVGGGPAGLKTAESAARRGHRVTLIEREQSLGGQVRLAARQPLHEEFAEITAYLEGAIDRLGVDVWLGVEASVDGLLELDPDVIVVATGSQPNLPARGAGPGRDSEPEAGLIARARGLQVLPEVPGLDLGHVFSADEVLLGVELPGRRVLVVDGNGHWEAVGTAEFLADAGYEVEVISQRPTIGSDLEASSFALFVQRSAEKKIRLSPWQTLIAVEPQRVRVAEATTMSERWIEPVDVVVPVLPRRSRDDLYLALRDQSTRVRVERVGDCVAPRLVQSVVLEAYELARRL